LTMGLLQSRRRVLGGRLQLWKYGQACQFPVVFLSEMEANDVDNIPSARRYLSKGGTN
jgi:hypothetical protein